MRSRIGVGEAADLSLLVIEQPADTLLWWVPFNLWAVLVWHADTMAKSPGRVMWSHTLSATVNADNARIRVDGFFFKRQLVKAVLLGAIAWLVAVVPSAEAFVGIGLILLGIFAIFDLSIKALKKRGAKSP